MFDLMQVDALVSFAIFSTTPSLTFSYFKGQRPQSVHVHRRLRLSRVSAPVSNGFLRRSFAGGGLPGEAGLLRQVADWSEEDVQQWLCEEGLQELAAVFRANNMDGAELTLLNKETVGELGIGESGIESRTSAQST